MTTKPWPESNPHPERGPLWVQWDRDPDDGLRDALMRDSLVVIWLVHSDAIAIARQLGQESPTPPTKKVLWKHAIGERLPDGSEVDAAWRARTTGKHYVASETAMSIQADDDGMVEVLA